MTLYLLDYITKHLDYTGGRGWMEKTVIMAYFQCHARSNRFTMPGRCGLLIYEEFVPLHFMAKQSRQNASTAP